MTPTSYASRNERLKTDLEAQVAEVVYNTTGKPLSSEQLASLLPGFDGMIAGLDELDDHALAAADALTIIARYGVGVDNVDLASAKRRGITVTNTPGANAKSVAELTVTLVMNLLRPVILASQLTKAGDWPRLNATSLEGKTVGLFGLGAIGKEVARRLAGFDCELLATDIQQDAVFASQHNVTYVPADTLLARSDVLSLHVPGTTETLGIVDAAFLGRMKPGAWLVNTARGDLVNEEELVRALSSGQLAGAALDVFRVEPPRPSSPLLALENVIPTPHMGSHADSAVNTMGRMAMEECLRVLGGLTARYKVV